MILVSQNMLLFLFLFVMWMCIGVRSDCHLSLQDDLPVVRATQPLYLQNSALWAPQGIVKKGGFHLRTSETVTVACTGSKRHVVLGNDTTQFDVVEAKCVDGKTFSVQQWSGPFKSIRCNNYPAFETEETKQHCYGNNKIYRVGFKVRGAFVKLYEICFDKDTIRTLYTKHQVDPSNLYLQPNGPKGMDFVKAGMFKTVNVAELYKASKQKERINKLLGEGMDSKYITKNQYLTRGHLSPRADYSQRAAQRGTYTYGNTAPQWRAGNAGDWQALEQAVRYRVHRLGRALDVFTGTEGQMSLADKDGRRVNITLADDKNNNGVLPVPLYFYKVLYDAQEKKAVAFVSINSPYYNTSEVKRLTFCRDICHNNPQMAWVQWRDNDATASFCCQYDDFAAKIKHLSLNVQGLFY